MLFLTRITKRCQCCQRGLRKLCSTWSGAQPCTALHSLCRHPPMCDGRSTIYAVPSPGHSAQTAFLPTYGEDVHTVP